MRSDEAIKQDVEKELQWDPEIDSPDMAFSVNNGVVTLTGFVRAYVEIGLAEAAAKRVAGVTGVASDIELRIPGDDPKPDPEIAREALQAIGFEWPSLLECIRLHGKDGWVVLEGEVKWNYQRERMEAAVRRVSGLKSMTKMLQTTDPSQTPSSEVLLRFIIGPLGSQAILCSGKARHRRSPAISRTV